MPPVVKLVSLHAAAGRREQLLRVLEPVRAASLDAPGTQTWTLHADSSDPDRMFIYERYQDESAAEAHDALPVLRAALPLVAECVTEPPEVIHAEILASAE
jgi:quinol monooxygenase YgiN